MITKFDSSYYGTADMENLGYKGTPINERSYSQKELAEGDAQGRALRQMHGRARLQHVLDGRAPFPAGRDGADPEPADDGDASVRRHEEPEDRLRLQHRADVASAAPRGRLRDGRHPDRRAGDLRRRARLSHPRGRDLRLAADRPGRQPRDLRGRRRDHLQGVRGQAVLAQGQVLHDPAGGAVSRLYAEGDHAGPGAGAPAGRMLAADPERLGARLRFHGEIRHQRRDRRRLGRGRRGRAAHARLPGGLCPARHQARTRRAPGARLPVPHRVEPRAGDQARPRRTTKRT